MCAVRTHTHTLINIIHKYESFTPAVPSQYVAAAAGPPPQSTSRVPAKSRHTTWRVLLEICCIPTWDGLATPVPEVRDFWKKASYEWRRRLASASRLALRWPLLPPFARRKCPRLTSAQRPEVCHPPRVCSRLKCAPNRHACSPVTVPVGHGKSLRLICHGPFVRTRSRSRCCHRESFAAT